MAFATACTVPSVAGRMNVVLFDMPITTLRSAITACAVPIDARVSAIAAYTPPCTKPIGWDTRGGTRGCPVSRPISDASSTTKPINLSNASSGATRSSNGGSVIPRRYCLVMAAGTWESYHAITTLLYRYAEYMDAADFDALEELFADAVLT